VLLVLELEFLPLPGLELALLGLPVYHLDLVE
jgi:hypothetical protein